MQHGGVGVGDVVTVLDGVKTQLVGGAVNVSALDAAARHPDGEGVGMVVSSAGSFRAGGSAELGGPDNQRLIQQAALFEVLQQPGNGFVDLPAQTVVALLQRPVGVPAIARGAVIDLHESHPPLG